MTNWPRRGLAPCGTITASRLSSQLRQLDFYDLQIAELDQEIARRLGMQTGPDDPEPQGNRPTSGTRPSSAAPMPDSGADLASRAPQPPSDPARSQAEVLRILDEVTGINQRIAQIVVAELGIQLDQFRSSGHVVSWAGLCPQAKISAGKRLSTKTGKGNRWLKQALIEAAHGAARSKNTYLGAYYQRLKVNFAYADLAKSVFTDTFGNILCVAFSPQGDLLAAGTTIGEIRVWHATNGLPLHTFLGHTNWVHSVAFSPDGKTLASGSGDQTIRLWEVGNGQCLYTLRSDRPYERMNITRVKGLTEVQKAILRSLGATEDEGQFQQDLV